MKARMLLIGLTTLVALTAWMEEVHGAEAGIEAQTGCYTAEKPAYLWAVSISPGVPVDRLTATYADDRVEIVVTVPLETPWGSSLRDKDYQTEESYTRFSWLALAVRNKTREPLRILWDESAITTPRGGTSRTIHSGTRFIFVDQPQVPTVVPPGAVIEDAAYPRELIGGTTVYDQRVYGGDQGKLWLTLEFNDGKRTYDFTFTIEQEASSITRLVCPGQNRGPDLLFWCLVILAILVLAALSGTVAP